MNDIAAFRPQAYCLREQSLIAIDAIADGGAAHDLVERIRDATLKGNERLLNDLILEVGAAGVRRCPHALRKLADKYGIRHYDAAAGSSMPTVNSKGMFPCFTAIS